MVHHSGMVKGNEERMQFFCLGPNRKFLYFRVVIYQDAYFVVYVSTANFCFDKS